MVLKKCAAEVKKKENNGILESDTTSDSASTTGSAVSEEQLPDRFDNNLEQNPEYANQRWEIAEIFL